MTKYKVIIYSSTDGAWSEFSGSDNMPL